MRDEPVHDQIQRLLDARDQKAFTQLLIDSVCSMPTDDFHRVREKLIRKFVNDQRRAAVSFDDIRPGQMIAKVEPTTDEQLDDGTQEDVTVMQNGDVNSSSFAAAATTTLSLKIVNVRSCSSEETDRSWSHNVEPSVCVGDQLTVKPEKPDASTSCDDHCIDVDENENENENENVTATNYITVIPTETTSEAAINGDSMTAEYRCGNETQDQYDTQPASAARGGQV